MKIFTVTTLKPNSVVLGPECVVAVNVCRGLPCLSTVVEAEVDGCCCNVAGDATTPVEWKQMNGDYIIFHARNTHKPLAVTAMLEIVDGSV